MPGTNNSVYEEPSRLSQGLVVGLSIAVVMMAGWFVVTITASPPATTAAEGETDAAAGPPAVTTGEGTAASGAVADAPRQRTRSVHFDWPEEFSSAPATPPSPPEVALPLAPKITATRGPGQPAWPLAPDARNADSRQPADARAADAIVDMLVPQPTHGAGNAAVPASHPAPHRQKPRTDSGVP